MNFRSIKEQMIEFDDYTCFVGANGSGKSNVLHALNVFFGEPDIPGLDTRMLSEEDFFAKDTSVPIEITVTFSDLSDEAQKDLSHYVRQNQLIVSVEASFDKSIGKAEVTQYGRRLAIKEFAPFFEAEKQGKKVAELKEIYEKIKKSFSDLPDSGPKNSMIDALRSYEEKHPEKCEEIPSADEFYGISKGKNHLEKHIQWVYVPAVKDAATEQTEAKNTALGKLLLRTVRSKVNFKDAINDIREEMQKRYSELLISSQGQLEEISNTLRERIVEWAHNDATLRLKWYQDPDKAIRVDEPFAQAILGEGGFEGELTRFGHGLQRSFLLALLQELSGSNIEGGPRLILACEEPELYQHPPQARYLYNVLLRLSEQNTQVLLASHSPYFVSGEGFESIRLVRKNNDKSIVKWTKHDKVSKIIAEAKGEKPLRRTGQLAKIHQALQPGLSEMFFASKIIFVEGLEDIAYVTTYLHLMNYWDEFRKLGCHVIPTQGKSEMLQPIAVSKTLEIPIFIIFDSDGDKPDRSGSREKNRKDNVAILKLNGISKPDPFPSNTFWDDKVVMWSSDIEQVIEDEIGKSDWERFRSEADSKYGHSGNLKKNTLHIASSLELAWNEGKKSKSLESVCENIIKFARQSG